MKWAKTIKFECTKCGQCCREPGVVVLESDDLFRLCEFLDLDQNELTERGRIVEHAGYTAIDVPEGSACPFLENDKCSVWAARPAQCRTYPFWDEILDSQASWSAERRVCPGIGEGRTWSAAEIREKRRNDEENG